MREANQAAAGPVEAGWVPHGISCIVSAQGWTSSTGHGEAAWRLGLRIDRESLTESMSCGARAHVVGNVLPFVHGPLGALLFRRIFCRLREARAHLLLTAEAYDLLAAHRHCRRRPSGQGPSDFPSVTKKMRLVPLGS